MIREKEKNNKEGRLWRLKKFEEESYREAVSSISNISKVLNFQKTCDIHFISQVTIPPFLFLSNSSY